MKIKYMKKIKRGKNHEIYEPKKSSPEPQSGTEELDSGVYVEIL